LTSLQLSTTYYFDQYLHASYNNNRGKTYLILKLHVYQLKILENDTLFYFIICVYI